MKSRVFLLPFCFLASACVIKEVAPPVTPVAIEPCHSEFKGMPAQEIGEVSKLQFQDQVIYKYKSFYFAKMAPLQLAEFIKANNIQLVMDFRNDGSDQGLDSKFPAVYYHLGIENMDTINHVQIQELYDHLSAFPDKSIIFVSKDGDVSVSAFVNYWSELHSLNDVWVTRTSTELGLRNPLWLKKWEEVSVADKS